MAKSQTLYVNNGRTTLGSTITTSSVSFTVADPSLFPTSLSAGQFFYVTLFDTVNIEIVKVTAVSGSTFTVTRAQQGTTAHAFTAAVTTVGQRATAADFSSFARLTDRMVPLTGLSSLALPSTMDGNSYVLGDNGPSNATITAVANTVLDIWSFVGYPAIIYTSTAGAGATTTVINVATATTVLPDQGSLVYILQFTSGAQKGTARFISSMTSSTITLHAALSGAPGSSDTYSVYRHVGTNVSVNATQQRQLLDPTFVTSTINYLNGDKRLNVGSFQMYDGATWNNYPLNYVASTTSSIGSYTVAAVNGGYAGFNFSGAFHSQALLASTTAKSSGVYSVSDTTWDWRWDAGILAVGTVPYANVSGTPNLTVYAPLASPTFTGVPAAPTAANGTNTTQLATTAFVRNSIVFTGNATAGTKTHVSSGIIEQWFEQFEAAAGGGIVTITYPVAFSTGAGKPRIQVFDANLASLGASNFVDASVVTSSLTGCTVNIGQNGGGTRDITLVIEVRGT
jgi:hypothetical protein